MGDPHLPPHRHVTTARVEKLLSRLSLRRKAAQIVQAERLHITPDQVREFGVGSVLSGGGSVPGENRPADWVSMHDAYRTASEIPILYGVDAIHGHNNVRGATVFPHNIGLGAAHDTELAARIARVAAREILATGMEWTFAPTLAVARDPRWGRTYESFSEDPELVSSYSAAIVRALHDEGVLACPKHWIGDGGTTGGVDQGDTAVDEDELRRTHLPGYRAALAAGARTVMVSLSSWNGVPCHGHRHLITNLLKGELGFEGLVLSDWNGILALASDFDEAVALGVNAGIDLFMVPEQWERFIGAVVRQVKRGRIEEARVNDAVRRILGVKEAWGLFDAPRPAARTHNPPGDAEGGDGSGDGDGGGFGSAAHRAVAREAVAKSLVLLKDDGGLLPLDPNARILVTGRLAHDRGALCGGFTLEWQGVRGNERIEGGTSIWEGIRAISPAARLLPPGTAPPEGGYDAAVVVIGERPYAEGCGDIRAWSGEPGTAEPTAPGGPATLEPYGDSLRLARLHPDDLATLRAFAGHPVVAVLVSGRPLVVEDELAAARAFVAAWLPGSEGAGVADALFGARPFRGRLAHAWPGADVARGEPRKTRFPVGYGLTTARRRHEAVRIR